MAASDDKNLSVLIKEEAYRLGFNICGIAPSRPLSERENILKEWCSSGMNDGMGFMARNIEKRINPEILVPGARSVIVTGLNYYSDKKQSEPGVPILSRYAFGEDYHDVNFKRLEKLLEFVRNICPGTDGRYFTDSAPILEKAWAREAGIGWQGRHSVVINEEIGSFFVIGILILNIELDYDKPFSEDNCGDCRLCIDSCPTGAINENHTIDARKCIANLTIESRGPVPEDIVPKMGMRVCGCDRCQEVCPWNRNAKPNNIPEFQLSEELEKMNREEWINLSPERFERLFGKTVIARRKYSFFMKNIETVIKSDSQK
ncbi:MAG TPA: tRNA epoxyqueuosine(34) reductase QueG [Bacteroidales bacterium]|nr:tRNA epoxyqueuosine(34) reductase QueG [Bacteroidales bacterium]